jgi:hypothetical protein
LASVVFPAPIFPAIATCFIGFLGLEESGPGEVFFEGFETAFKGFLAFGLAATFTVLAFTAFFALAGAGFRKGVLAFFLGVDFEAAFFFAIFLCLKGIHSALNEE